MRSFVKPSLDYVEALLGFSYSFLFRVDYNALTCLKCLSYLFNSLHVKSLLSINEMSKRKCNGFDNIHDGLEKLIGS
jgi:hypothetical protein